MPNYDYQCDKCHNIQEETHPMRGPLEPIICKNCGSNTMSKHFSLPYVKFDGPGWQTNDTRGIAKTDTGQDIDSGNFRD